MKFDINEARKIAGLPVLTERFHDEDSDDGLSSSERALANKADSDLSKKGIKVGNVDPDKDMAKMAAKESPVKPAAAVAKPAAAVAAASEVAKKKGKAVNPDSKRSKVAAAYKASPTMTRKEFIAMALTDHAMTANYAALMYQSLKAKVAKEQATEGFILIHPQASTFMLGENREMNQYQWIDASSTFQVVVCETKEEAESLAKYMREIKNQQPIIEYFDLDSL